MGDGPPDQVTALPQPGEYNCVPEEYREFVLCGVDEAHHCDVTITINWSWDDLSGVFRPVFVCFVEDMLEDVDKYGTRLSKRIAAGWAGRRRKTRKDRLVSSNCIALGLPVKDDGRDEWRRSEWSNIVWPFPPDQIPYAK
jgi:hypothetical protein